MTVPTQEPTEFSAGDSLSWIRKSAVCKNPGGDELKASDGWTLTYSLVKENQIITLTAAPSGDDYLVSETAAETLTYKPGLYNWAAYCTKAAERYRVGTGQIDILIDFATQSTGYDPRNHTEKVIDALQARLEKRADKHQNALAIHGETIGLMPIHRVLEWLDKYKRLRADEIAAERVAQGLGHDANIYVRFTEP